MQYKVTNIIALVKHKNMLDRTEQICRFFENEVQIENKCSRSKM